MNLKAPAFPYVRLSTNDSFEPGMTKVQWTATQVLVGLCANSEALKQGIESVTTVAFELAKALCEKVDKEGF